MATDEKNNTIIQEENWLPVRNYEGLYEVSDLGNVRNAKTKKVLKPVKQKKHDYYTVNLSKEGVVKTYMIHRLVAEVHCDNSLKLNEVNHKDFDTHNNEASNLEYCTHSYNINYSTTGNSPISQYTINEEFIKRYPDMNSILAEYPLYNRSNINMNLKGWTQTAYGFKWKYDFVK